MPGSRHVPEHDDTTDDDPAAIEAGFQRLRKQSGKELGIKGDRRQQGKEFGKMIHKAPRQRRDQNEKP